MTGSSIDRAVSWICSPASALMQDDFDLATLEIGRLIEPVKSNGEVSSS